MQLTDIFILPLLDLNIGDEITLLDLDDRVAKFVNNNDLETPLMFISPDEIIEDEEYLFFSEESAEIFYKINFEVVGNVKAENTVIKITR